MSLVIDLAPPIEARLEEEARKAGVAPEALVARIVGERLGAIVDPVEEARRNSGSIALLESWLAEARRRRSTSAPQTVDVEDLDVLLEALDATRRDSGERLLFPGAEPTRKTAS